MGTIARFVRIALPAALLLAAAIVVPVKLLDQYGYKRVEKLGRDLAQIAETNRALERENESLRLQIRAFHSDPEYIEKVARDELGMVGTKYGCGAGLCGSCTVHLNGTPMRSCVTPISATSSKTAAW